MFFKSILVYNLKTISDFWSKCSHDIMGYMINWVLYFSYFHMFWIWHILIIHCTKFEEYTWHAVFAMLWPFQWMLVPRFPTGWSVAKLFGGFMINQHWIRKWLGIAHLTRAGCQRDGKTWHFPKLNCIHMYRSVWKHLGKHSALDNWTIQLQFDRSDWARSFVAHGRWRLRDNPP